MSLISLDMLLDARCGAEQCGGGGGGENADIKSPHYRLQQHQAGLGTAATSRYMRKNFSRCGAVCVPRQPGITVAHGNIWSGNHGGH